MITNFDFVVHVETDAGEQEWLVNADYFGHGSGPDSLQVALNTCHGPGKFEELDPAQFAKRFGMTERELECMGNDSLRSDR